jgi:dihydrofolate synthase / folylpolyglutamate synthase
VTQQRARGEEPPARAASEAYRATLERLFRRRRFGLRPGVEVEAALLKELGQPERSFPAVHVTGSKGKGSVAAMTAAILSAHGLKTGLFTSPHLASYRERMRIDGVLVSPEEVVEGVARVEAAADRLLAEGRVDRAPTFFEVTTAVAFDWFARHRVDAAVVEVGIGGRLDATNVLDSRVGVVTTIELEHTEILGPTHAAIAREKCGILRPGMAGIVGELPRDAATVVGTEAGRVGVPLWTLGREIRIRDRTGGEEGQAFACDVPGLSLGGLRLRLLGGFQAGNAALAVGAASRLLTSIGRPVQPDRIRTALREVRWPGRLERIGRAPDLYYDVAHTPGSARAVAVALGEIDPALDPTQNAIVFGCLAGKDVPGILTTLAPIAQTLVVVPVRSERSLRPSELRASAVGRFARIVEAPDARAGLRVARAATGDGGFTLVIGSDYLIGELARGGTSDEPDLSDPGVGAYGEPGTPALRTGSESPL